VKLEAYRRVGAATKRLHKVPLSIPKQSNPLTGLARLGTPTSTSSRLDAHSPPRNPLPVPIDNPQHESQAGL